MEYVVVLVAALAHAIWNGLVKNSGDKLLSLTLVRFIGLIFGLIVIATHPPLDWVVLPYILTASGIHFIYFYCLINTYKYGDFSQVYPISRGLASLLVLAASLLFLSDRLGIWQASGSLLIGLGLLLLATNKQGIDKKPVWFAAATACCIAGYTLVSGVGVRMSGSFLLYAGWLELVAGVGMISYCFVRRGSSVCSYAVTHWKHGLATGVLSIGGYTAALWAMTKAPIASVAALRETSIIFAVLIGVFWFKEHFVGKRILASCIVVSGIALIMLF